MNSPETITPEFAEALLSRGGKNRKTNKNRVAQYASYMKGDEWIVNGETIVLDSEGRVIDGQHRLKACVTAGVPFSTFVARGVSDEMAQHTTDVGQSRSVGQQLQLMGYKNYNGLASALRWRRVLASLWNHGSFTALKYSVIEAVHDLENHPGITESVSRFATISSGVTRFSLRVGAALDYEARAAGHLAEDVDAFWDLYHDLDLPAPRAVARPNHPVTMLIGQVRKVRADPKDGKLNAKWLSAITIKAFNAFILGEGIGLLRWRQGGASPESFPEFITMEEYA